MLETRNKDAKEIARELDFSSLEAAERSNTEADMAIGFARIGLAGIKTRIAQLKKIEAEQEAEIKSIEEGRHLAQNASLTQRAMKVLNPSTGN